MDGARINGAGSEGAVEGRAVFAALAAARAEFARATKDATNPHLKNRYPTLASIIEACDEALGRHRLTYSQPIVQMPGGPVLRTILVHLDTGDRIESDCPLLYDTGTRMNPMQALGSAVTYARRYSLETLLGLMREDDDGEGAFARARPEGSREASCQRVSADHAEPVREPLIGRTSKQAGSDEPLPKPFRAWARSAAALLGVEERDLIDHLHDAAVREGHMSAVAQPVRAQAMAQRYHDRRKGREWRDWMRDQCKAFQAERLEQAAAV